MTDSAQLVKVGFRDDDGQVETLWAFDLGNGRFRLDNAPWYQYGVSYRDVIEASPEPDGLPFVVRVLEKSGYRTLRIRSDKSIPEQLLEAIKSAGASYEGATRNFMAVDVPPGIVLESIVSLVTASGIEWEYADPTYEQLYPADV